MCGIVGGVSKTNIVPFLLQGLQRMEYRGYDSAGLAIIQNGTIKRVRKVGKVASLVSAVQSLCGKEALDGNIGLAHTRWATHGVPSEVNAHPHLAGNRVLVAHNGIIENFQELKAKLEASGSKFESDTDSEVIAHLVLKELQQLEVEASSAERSDAPSLLVAVSQAIKRMTGSFAFVALDAKDPYSIVAAAMGAPLVVGRAEGKMLVASDPLALADEASEVVYLAPGELVHLTLTDATFFKSLALTKIKAVWQVLEIESSSLALGAFDHFMLKEIYEQPQIADCWLKTALNSDLTDLVSGPYGAIWPKVKRVKLVACGTSFYAALLGKLWLEKWAQLPSQVEVASEFRYNFQVVEPGTLLIVISQSGETADTLAALRLAKQLGYLATLTISNVAKSTLMREADLTLLTKAGVEIGVASTKALTAQLIALILLGLSFNRTPKALKTDLLQELNALSSNLSAVIKLEPKIKALAKKLASAPHLFFLGRTTSYPIALEGALKMKELSYLHAEGLAAGELKHGPLALIEVRTPVVALVANDAVASKMLDNLHEVASRGGEIIVLAEEGLSVPDNWISLKLPLLKELASLSFLPALQLLAYHVALIRGCDVDKPRNLAKSVTVE